MYNGVKKQHAQKSDINSESESESLKSDYFMDLSANELFYCLSNKANGDFDDCLWRDMKIKDFDELFSFMQEYSQLFTEGTVLDVGCGDGQFSLLFSLIFKPKKLVGIDISKNCLLKASELKNRVLEPDFSGRTSEESEVTRFMAKCPSSLIQPNKIKHFDPVYRNNFIRDFRKYTDDKVSKEEAIRLKKGILFKMQNIFNYNESYQFSVILCLSVTKWVALNFGLSGIRKLFDRLKALLEYKGILVMDEPSMISFKHTIKKHKEMQFKALEFNFQQIIKMLVDEYKFIVIKEKVLTGKNNKRVYILLSL